jgi:hypothetical protein
MDTLLDQIDALAVENKDKDNWHRKSAISLQESF